MDVFELCAFKTKPEGAADALRLILKSGLPPNIKVKDLRSESEFDLEAGLLHLVAEYTTLETTELALKFTEILFEFGASWMLLDGQNRTPGDIAFNKNKRLYERFVHAGFTSEIFLQKMSLDESEEDGVEVNQDQYLKDKLEFSNETLQTSKNDGVMMDWETPIMQRSADLISGENKQVLNIGFGMGIIDKFIEKKNCKKHYIIEAHPQVLAKMKKDGWFDKKNVVVLNGTWKSKLPELIDLGVQFDFVYYDTFSEHYRDMLTLFDYLLGLLKFDGTFSYFNGLGADRQVCYDVYRKVVEFNLKDYGLHVDFENIKVDLDKENWEGIKHEYFKLKTYYLPIVRFADLEADSEEGEFVI